MFWRSSHLEWCAVSFCMSPYSFKERFSWITKVLFIPGPVPSAWMPVMLVFGADQQENELDGWCGVVEPCFFELVHAHAGDRP